MRTDESQRRPERERLTAELGQGDVLVALKVDRLARSVGDLLGIVKRADEVGASVVFVDQQIDTRGPYGQFTLTLLAALAELEAGIIRERVKGAIETIDRDGRHGYGRLPFGFCIEQLAEIDIEIDDCFVAMRNRPADRLALMEQVETLERRKTELQQGKPKGEMRLVHHGTMAKHWAESDDDYRVHLMTQAMRVVVHPASARHRLLVEDRECREHSVSGDQGLPGAVLAHRQDQPERMVRHAVWRRAQSEVRQSQRR